MGPSISQSPDVLIQFGKELAFTPSWPVESGIDGDDFIILNTSRREPLFFIPSFFAGERVELTLT